MPWWCHVKGCKASGPHGRADWFKHYMEQHYERLKT